jgi:hypothetical protein
MSGKTAPPPPITSMIKKVAAGPRGEGRPRMNPIGIGRRRLIGLSNKGGAQST